jgi:hypothetical protein
MAKTYVVINDPVHALFRSMTRRVALCPHCMADGQVRVEVAAASEDLPEVYHVLAVFRACTGLRLFPTSAAGWGMGGPRQRGPGQRMRGLDVLEVDRRCCRDLRLRFDQAGTGLLARELLSFGTGMLRARNDDALDPLQRCLWEQHGRIESRHEAVLARIGALHWNSIPCPAIARKESFDSTNVIYGDAFGQVEQLWNRRADTEFLGQVAQSLRRTGQPLRSAASLCPPLNLETVMKLHFRAQARWKAPPGSGRALLRRIEYILEHATIDDAPETVFGGPTSAGASAPGHFAEGGAEWEDDGSGYDGWLRPNL